MFYQPEMEFTFGGSGNLRYFEIPRETPERVRGTIRAMGSEMPGTRACTFLMPAG